MNNGARFLPALIIAGLVILAIAFLTFYFGGDRKRPEGDLSCVSSREERIVRGNSLAGIVEDGETVEILFGYYLCNEPRMDDIVAFYHAGSSDPLIKIVKAVPGDAMQLVPDGAAWKLLINGAWVAAPGGRHYTVNADRYPRLRLYEEDYGQGFPEGTYLLLGTDAADSFDSRAFGLVNKSDILGAVFPVAK